MTPASFLAWRKRLGLTKIEAARRLGVGRNTIAAYEAGRTPIPRHIAILCHAIAIGLEPHP